jgi:hypothetical protein
MITLRKILITVPAAIFPLILLADDPGVPCIESADPMDNTCPLDSWIIVLAAAAFIFAAVHLYRKQKRSLPATNKS